LIIYIAIRSVPWPIFRDLGNVRIEMDDRYNPYGLDGSPNFSFLNLSRVLLFSGLFSLLGVLAMLISVAVYLRKKRIAFVTGLPQYTGLVSNYFAVHILLLYFISLPFLAVIEAKHKAQFDKQVQHEGRAMAQSVNKKWPE
jgi:hypothetical protein